VSEIGSSVTDPRCYKGHLPFTNSTPNSKPSLQSPVMAYYVPSTPRHRGRSYSLSQPSQMAGSSYPYPTTPYSGYNQLAPSYNTGYNTPQTFYVAPSEAGRSRSRSRSRPAHSHHGHGHSGRRSRSHHRSHGHQRRSHSTTSHRHQRPSHHVRFSMSKPERSAQFSLVIFSLAHTNLLKQE
jgi:hypothetical protein